MVSYGRSFFLHFTQNKLGTKRVLVMLKAAKHFLAMYLLTHIETIYIYRFLFYCNTLSFT